MRNLVEVDAGTFTAYSEGSGATFAVPLPPVGGRGAAEVQIGGGVERVAAFSAGRTWKEGAV